MRARQHLHLRGELANLGRLAIVDTAIVFDYRLTHDSALDFFECFEHFAFAAAEARDRSFGEIGNDLRLQRMHLLATLLLFLDREGVFDFADSTISLEPPRKLPCRVPSGVKARFGLPARRFNSCCISKIGAIASCAM